MKKNIILGTAGHIDHGKTSLVKALTGIETDRLKEERERGITIELGFASLLLSTGQTVGIVDMPGHEKFVKNMVAGASGIDVVTMVIAADEGVMPQTKEHMEICNLMGVEHGMIALTKIDLVDDDLLELALEDINDFVKGTFLENKPVVAISCVNDDGIKDFVLTLENICASIKEKKTSSLFKLPIDRVFSMKGFGTVITGTLTLGNINVGDNVMIYPEKITSKIRGIQVHGSMVEKAEQGMRTAINLQSLDKKTLNRGDVLSTPDTLIPSYIVDAQFHYLKTNEKPIKNRTKIRFHSGTREFLGYIILLDKDELFPNEKAFVQFKLESFVCCIKDDRYVVRSYSPVKTIGGGAVLNPLSKNHKRFNKTIIQGIQSLCEKNHEESILFFLSLEKHSGLSFAKLRIMTNLSEKKLLIVLQKLLSTQKIILVDKEKQIYIHEAFFKVFTKTIIQKLDEYHTKNPLKKGMPTQELKSKFQYIKAAKFFNIVFNKLSEKNLIVLDKDLIRLSKHKVALKSDQHKIKEDIKQIYKISGLTPPFFKDICAKFKIEKKTAFDVLDMLILEKEIIKAKEELFFHKDNINSLKQKLIGFLSTKGSITTSEFKNMTNVSRKYAIPLIEYFDSIKLTIRIGDTRQLRK